MSCEFLKVLSRLRKQSQESVDNTDTFDPFKVYMHIERSVETELRKLVQNVNEKQKKCLIMLCGSTGDGKSHLISFLKNADRENMLSDYEPYNDATESEAPSLTDLDMLSEKLSSFNDDNIDNQEEKKLIIAINLGVLNKFIESEEGKKFTKLKKYVEENEIMSTYARKVGYIENSPFQHVSFSDYQVFSLGENGVETEYLEALLEKIFSDVEDNPFYKCYRECTCSMKSRCPVRHNYEFMQDKNHQKEIIRRIIEVVIENKAIVSTREILNFLYDIMVHPDFSYDQLNQLTADETMFLTKYIDWTTPMLLNEFKDISPLIDVVRMHDVLKCRKEYIDYRTMRFHALDNIEEEYDKVTKNTPYHEIMLIAQISHFGGIKPDLKKSVYRFLVRLDSINNKTEKTDKQKLLDQYIMFLYHQNMGNTSKLSALYEMTRLAILGWDGQFESEYICIDNSNNKYWILEHLALEPREAPNAVKADSPIDRFSPIIKVYFGSETTEDKMVKIEIDFSLFELITNMKMGYKPTVEDRNHHTDFMSSISELIELGNKSKKVTVLSKNGEGKFVFTKTFSGYDFRAV